MHCLFNIGGDLSLIASGMEYENPIRAFAALMGVTIHLFGIFYRKETVFGRPVAVLVMRVVMVCGFLYILSGTNLLGFEGTMRILEMVGGFGIMLSAFFVILGRGTMAATGFLIVTAVFAGSSFEVMLYTGVPDYYVLLGTLMFSFAAIAAKFIKTPSVTSVSRQIL